MYMNWYKRAELESNWWTRFYEHLSQTASFILNDAGIQFDSRSVGSINDGRNASFIFKATHENIEYSCRIQLQFSERLGHLNFGAMGEGRLMGIPNQPTENLLRSQVSVIAENPTRLVDSSILQAQETTPSVIMSLIRDLILSDQNTVDNDEEEYNNFIDDKDDIAGEEWKQL